MSEKKVKAVDVRIDEKEPQVVPSQTKESYAALIAEYAKKNPVKYALKKKVLEERLAAL